MASRIAKTASISFPRPRGLIFLVSLLLFVGGCSVALEPAQLVLDEEICAHCRMALSQRSFSAQVVWESGRVDFFDDIGCLLDWMSSHSPPSDTAVFVVDYESGRWLKAQEATYILSEQLNTPMKHGLAAFASRAGADEKAAALGGRVLDWETLPDKPTR